MAYVAELASRQSQFGRTVIEFNLVDNTGILPYQRIHCHFPTETPTNAEILAERNARAIVVRDRAIAELKEQNDRETFRDRLKDFVEARLAALKVDFDGAVANSNLNADQKAFASRVTFDWRIS